jgi:hypothetical protein
MKSCQKKLSTKTNTFSHLKINSSIKKEKLSLYPNICTLTPTFRIDYSFYPYIQSKTINFSIFFLQILNKLVVFGKTFQKISGLCFEQNVHPFSPTIQIQFQFQKLNLHHRFWGLYCEIESFCVKFGKALLTTMMLLRTRQHTFGMDREQGRRTLL